MPTAYLADRGLIEVAGDEATSFLQGLVTCNVDTLPDGEARLGALLSPPGKILFDFLISRAPEGGFLLDMQRALVPDMVKRLGFYKLRAKVEITPLTNGPDGAGVMARWAEDETPLPDEAIVVRDARLPELGLRVYASEADAQVHADAPVGAYHTHRITLGVPEGGKDFIYGDVFPHEVDMDQLGGVDFAKGCYVGQEVVSRMEHRGTARTRIVPIVFPDGIVPLDGLDAVAGDKALGKLGSCANGRGLALLRLDRVADALTEGLALTAGGLAFELSKPAWARFAFPGEAAST
jgi:folate-binding protein YgfZ